MQERTPVIGLHEIRQRPLTDLLNESQTNPQLTASSLLSNSSDTPLCCFQDPDNNLEFAEQSLKEAHHRFVPPTTAAKRQRNAWSPIFKLPTDILGRILEMTLDLDLRLWQEYPRDEGPSHVEHLLTLASVSSQFYSLVMDTGTLWAVVDSRCSPSQVRRSLERSRGRLITVKYRSKGKGTSNRTIVPTWWVDSLISKHIARWRDAELVLDSEELASLCEVAAPQLRRLVVSCEFQSYETRDDPLHLFGGNAPNLTVAELTGFFIHWEWVPSMIANLRSLVIRRVRISNDSVGFFLSAIPSSSMLEKLVMWHLRLHGPVEFTPLSPAWLYHLKEIEIVGLSEDVFRYFLGTIRAPHVRNAKVDHPYCLDTEAWGSLVLRCLDNSILQHVEQALHIELYFGLEAVCIYLFTDTGPPVRLQLCHHFVLDGGDPIVWMLENILAYQKRSTLTVRLPLSYIEYTLPRLLRLKDVTKLELEYWFGSFRYHSFLSSPISNADGNQWLWPRLTSVTIIGCGGEGAGEAILAIVKGRLEGSSAVCGTENPAGAHEEGGRPSPIQSVHIQSLACLSASMARQLENLVPNVQLPLHQADWSDSDSDESEGTL